MNTNIKLDNDYYTPIQVVLPVDYPILIKFDDPIYTFDEVMKGSDISKYIKPKPSYCKGRKGFNPITMLKVILFGYMERGFISLRELETACRYDIRYMYLLRNEKKVPTHQTFNNFIHNYLEKSIEEIFVEVNDYILPKENVKLDTLLIDGTKIEANANKYSWVWKESCITNRNKLFKKISIELEKMNEMVIGCYLAYYEVKEEYTIEELELILADFQNRFNIDPSKFVKGKGKRKTEIQRTYEKMERYIKKLKEYAEHIEICGEKRNSYSKTDKDATFFRHKRDYMGNDQLLPSYNIQFGVIDEYIVVCDVYQYGADCDCFEPLIEKFKEYYGRYPKRPVADAGYGNYNNYLYCKEKNMELYMKFPLYNKLIKDKKYRENPFKVHNFKKNEKGELVCPNNKVFKLVKKRLIKGNKYERTEEIYECEDCTGCPYKEKCYNGKNNRKVNINQELTDLHQEVIKNLNSEEGIELRKLRSAQVEGTIGILKQDRGYRRIVRRGLKNVRLELLLISIGYNLYKYHNKKLRKKPTVIQ
ncbi:MAG: IS1182 family transposase [Bacilli bacterium]|nr:IS1182 family transposase [Bacilli bacterium]